jgi:hypothetical protein
MKKSTHSFTPIMMCFAWRFDTTKNRPLFTLVLIDGAMLKVTCSLERQAGLTALLGGMDGTGVCKGEGHGLCLRLPLSDGTLVSTGVLPHLQRFLNFWGWIQNIVPHIRKPTRIAKPSTLGMLYCKIISRLSSTKPLSDKLSPIFT